MHHQHSFKPIDEKLVLAYTSFIKNRLKIHQNKLSPVNKMIRKLITFALSFIQK